MILWFYTDNIFIIWLGVNSHSHLSTSSSSESSSLVTCWCLSSACFIHLLRRRSSIGHPPYLWTAYNSLSAPHTIVIEPDATSCRRTGKTLSWKKLLTFLDGLIWFWMDSFSWCLEWSSWIRGSISSKSVLVVPWSIKIQHYRYQASSTTRVA